MLPSSPRMGPRGRAVLDLRHGVFSVSFHCLCPPVCLTLLHPTIQSLHRVGEASPAVLSPDANVSALSCFRPLQGPVQGRPDEAHCPKWGCTPLRPQLRVWLLVGMGQNQGGNQDDQRGKEQEGRSVPEWGHHMWFLRSNPRE